MSSQTSSQSNSQMNNGIVISSNTIEKEIQNLFPQLPNEFKYEIVRAYGLIDNYSDEELNKKVKMISEMKKTYPNLLKVLYSNRHPYTIMLLASNIGMYIPGSKRHGIIAYQFYLANVKYYETVITREQIPTLKDIYMNDDKLSLLLSMKDDQILVSNYTYTINYSDRLVMLKNFIKTNIDVYGYFELRSNTRSIYNSDNPSMFYFNNLLFCEQIASSSHHYSTTNFLKLIDEKNRCVYANGEKTATFPNLALLQLRKIIIEKLVKWRLRDNSDEIGSSKLYKIQQKLDKVLENESRISSEVFFKTYMIMQ